MSDVIKEDNKELNINDFSKNLFWDVDQRNFNPAKNERWLFKRVLEYGDLSDWKVIVHHYSIKRIVEELKEVRSLEPRALNFIATISNTPVKNFKCYTQKSLSRKHWIY
jgi:uncharacterized protein DUF6922